MTLYNIGRENCITKRDTVRRCTLKAQKGADMAENTTNIDNANEPTKEEPKPASPSLEELAKQISDLQVALEKQKKATDNASSDAASWKQKYKATLTEAQQAEEARKEAEAAKDKRIAELERKDIIGTYSNRALALGYDADLAKATAEAMANGDMSAVFDGIGQLIQTVKTQTITDSLAKQASLSTGTPPSANTVKEDEENQYRKWMGLPPKRN